jgi:hypothetical protein
MRTGSTSRKTAEVAVARALVKTVSALLEIEGGIIRGFPDAVDRDGRENAEVILRGQPGIRFSLVRLDQPLKAVLEPGEARGWWGGWWWRVRRLTNARRL